MSKFLYKMGAFAYKKPWVFIVSWIVILGAIIGIISTSGINVSTETRIDGTESQDVLDQLAENFPIASGGQGSFIFEAPNGEQIDAPENIEPLLDTINEIYNLNYVINPMEIMQEQGQENGEDMQA